MAKILSVDLLHVPEVINVGDDISDITVETQIEFHEIDIKHEMEYMLILFVYDILGELDVPVIIGNWDESQVITIADGRKDHFLGKEMTIISSDKKILKVQTSIALNLGELKEGASYVSKKLEVFATIIPAIGRASKWSKPFESKLIH